MKYGMTALLALVLAGCHTVKGVGEDMQKAGEHISETATDVQQSM